MKFVKPLDKDLLKEIFEKFDKIITIEDGVISGGYGSAILELAMQLNYKGKIEIMGIPDNFIEHGNINELQEIAGINVEGIRQKLETLN